MSDREIIQKMISIIDKIQAYVAPLDYKSFTDDDMLVEACAFNFGQLGEISHRLSEDSKTKNPTIPWKAIYGMRNKIIHDYDGVNLKVIWETITEALPALNEQLKSFLKGLD